MRPRGEVLARLRRSRAAGGVRLATVSGILTTRPALVRWVDRSVPEVEMITTKSYQVRPNPGYREPVVVEHAPGCYANAVGLRNPGMEEGLREQIFQPFYSTKLKGTGLGLPITKRYIEQHGGTVSVENNRAGGATFIITYPVKIKESTTV